MVSSPQIVGQLQLFAKYFLLGDPCRVSFFDYLYYLRIDHNSFCSLDDLHQVSHVLGRYDSHFSLLVLFGTKVGGFGKYGSQLFVDDYLKFSFF